MVLLLENQAAGPSSKFSDSDVFFLLDHLRNGNRIGRSILSKYLGIGEGSTRSILNILESHQMVRITKAGVSIQRNGQELLNALGMRSVNTVVPGYVLGEYQQGIILKDSSEKVFNGIEQRNCGIRAGGDGCTTWTMEDGVLYMLPDWNVDEENPTIASMIRETSLMKEGDVLIIGGGKTRHLAMSAAGTAALELI